jgi:DnaA initiator-associating protein
MNPLKLVQNHFLENVEVKKAAAALLPNKIVSAASLMIESLKSGNKILCCGNGGSASDAQHFSAEMLNRFKIERPPLAAIALTTDTSTLTAIANDYSYDLIFAKQIEALGKEKDILLVISTSGNSQNILSAIERAHQSKMPVIALTGKNGGKIAKILDANDAEIRVPSEITARIQETHILIIHCICDVIEQSLFSKIKKE